MSDPESTTAEQRPNDDRFGFPLILIPFILWKMGAGCLLTWGGLGNIVDGSGFWSVAIPLSAGIYNFATAIAFMLLKPWAWILTLLYTLLWSYLSLGTSDAAFACTVNLVAIGYLLW